MHVRTRIHTHVVATTQQTRTPPTLSVSLVRKVAAAALCIAGESIGTLITRQLYFASGTCICNVKHYLITVFNSMQMKYLI